MCRSAAEGGRRCSGRSCGAASARQRQAKSRARRGLEAAYAAGDIEAIGTAKLKYTRVTGEPPPPKPAPKPAGPVPDFATRKARAAALPKTGTTEDRIRAAVGALEDKTGGWIGLTDLREALGDIHPDELSRGLRELSRTGNANLCPESNRRMLQQQDHDAAVKVGGEAQHLISIQKHQLPQR